MWALASTVVSIAMAALLFPAGIAKLRDLRGFTDVVRTFSILPDFAVRSFAFGLPILETMVGTALLCNALINWSFTAWAGAGAVVLFGLFSIAIAINLVRGRTEISCGCFGKNSRKLTWWLVARGMGCAFLSVLTLPFLHPGVALVGGLSDRVAAVLIGLAIVAMAWLGHFVITGGTTAFESRSS